jgi:hypothetical protein
LIAQKVDVARVRKMLVSVLLFYLADYAQTIISSKYSCKKWQKMAAA